MDVNVYSTEYDYFYKFDIANFFDSIDINLLFELINEKKEILDTRSSLIYKRLLQLIGDNKFPTIENSPTLSYLATYIYLDEVDFELEEKLEKYSEIENFQIIRYVDDLYIFFDTESENLNFATSKIKNGVIDTYRKVKLNLNESKTKSGKSCEVDDTLNAALYEHYVNNEEVNISQYFNKENIELFLEDLFELSYSHNHKKFKEKLDEHFNKEGITYSSDEVFRYLAYYEKELFREEEIVCKVKKLILKDYSFINYNVNVFLSIILNTEDGQLIKYLLNEMFKKVEFNSFDVAISLNYLLLRNFKHYDLMSKVEKSNPVIIDYINNFCKKDWLKELDKKYNYIVKLNIDETVLDDSSIVWYLYFLYKFYDKNGDILEAFAYFKTYFDRMVSLLMHYQNVSVGRKGKPDFKRHYKVNNTKTDFRKLDSNYYEKENVEDLLNRLYKFRHSNPINHSSAELIEDEQLKKREIVDLIRQSEILLNKSFSI